MRLIKTTQDVARSGPITRYYFRNGEQNYLVRETILSNGNRQYYAFVYFYRETRNVFGNGSTGVSQSGWRRLPYGPKQRELEREAELIFFAPNAPSN